MEKQKSGPALTGLVPSLQKVTRHEKMSRESGQKKVVSEVSEVRALHVSEEKKRTGPVGAGHRTGAVRSETTQNPSAS